jgi:enoyl-CoA hydratase/carnithine racemase
MASSGSPISYEIKGKFAVITLNKPKRLNALILDEFGDLAATLQEIDKIESVVVTILTGTGKFFSA